MISRVAVVILSYNNVGDTLACVQSVAASNVDPVIYIVDNGSRPEIVQELKKEVQKLRSVTLISSKENLGFAAGMNLGIKRSLAEGAEWVFVLNNDTVLDKDAITELVKGATMQPRVAIAVPKILYFHDKSLIWYAGSKEAWPYPKHLGMGQRDEGQFDTTQPIPFATGCAMLIKAEVLKQVGLLDERYFFGMEDREFSLRCLQAGYTIQYVPSSVIYHKVGLTRKGAVAFDRAYLGYLSQLFFIRTTRSKACWISWFITYGIYLALLLPIRTIVTAGPAGCLNTWKAALSAWLKAWHAERAWPYN